ncbi:N-acetylglucosamine-6-phosphate deacetylase isoform X2 [Drosophila mauritiana]|uniref:N-acetylglucosamine-6-phosphate deacetylase isoform X2 n=1 Tax=Drosophila mauritiana TaxID=7226 RepID=A0A6P8L859_DROMA|nr:N-acetylglucosamine-6-phosphate deacetylase isoform X2 [Drosophila mauritiana]
MDVRMKCTSEEPVSPEQKIPASSQRLLQFTNCRLVRDHRIIHEDLWVRDGRIVNPEPVFFDERAKAHCRIDCGGAIIAPGYIDLQINGGYGVDFSYDTETIEEGVATVARGLVKSGVTSFCPTLVTSPSDSYHTILPRIPAEVPKGAGILGIHAEGPFINPQKKGAHPEHCIQTIDKHAEGDVRLAGTHQDHHPGAGEGHRSGGDWPAGGARHHRGPGPLDGLAERRREGRAAGRHADHAPVQRHAAVPPPRSRPGGTAGLGRSAAR